MPLKLVAFRVDSEAREVLVRFGQAIGSRYRTFPVSLRPQSPAGIRGIPPSLLLDVRWTPNHFKLSG